MVQDAAGWAALLHTAADGRSRVDSADFFFSPQGHNNPIVEWQATTQAMLKTGESGRQARCRFPARRQLLARHNPHLAALPPDECPDYAHWRRRLNPQSATLVFASAYLGNPSSMFGHTFLRLDAGGNPLLSWAVNFSAQTADAKGLTFAWKGLTGGYPGRFGLAPYYDKVTEYARLEQRELWEYQLALGADDVDLLLAHLWEMRDVHFDYYFFQENCSFQLLALLQVVRPQLPLTQGFDLFAAPVDTVRRLRKHGLISQLNRRPALQFALRSRLAALPAASRDWLAQQLNAPERALIDGVPPPQAAASSLDVLADLAQLQQQRTDGDGVWPALQKRALRLRSSYHQASEVEPLPSSHRPDSGHNSQRIGVAWRYQDHSPNALEVSWRPVLHDALDGPRGYLLGSEITVLDSRLRWQDEHLKLQRLDLFDVRALPLRDRWFAPLSWQLGVGYARDDFTDADFWQGRAAVGGSWAMPLLPAAQTSLLARGAVLLGKGGQRGVESGLEWTLQGHWALDWPWQLKAYWSRRDGILTDHTGPAARVSLGQQWQINSRFALRMRWQQHMSEDWHAASLQLLHYF